ncbi:hypothetical protein ACFP56_11000 [Paenibacillus septentrionalis]|uniref:DUF4145 domain-containing protein n=1 Tax=Paenibacillus septentrionalis TaxID=429342 RepID=A0ABW1V5Q4_9BACL
MDALEFTSSIVKTLAWPIIVLVIVFLLKKPITQLLLSISKFKYNNLEMDFGKELNKIEETLEKQSIEQTTLNNTISTINKEKENEVLSLAEIHPSAAISVVWTMIEKEIANTIKRLAISPDYPPYNSTLKNINLLKDNKYIDTITYELLNEFRHLRNKVTHAHSEGEQITYKEAVKYYELSIKLINQLRDIKR